MQSFFNPVSGPWKLNINLLKNKKVVGKYKIKLQQRFSLQPLYESVGEWWESIKARPFFVCRGRIWQKGGSNGKEENRLVCKDIITFLFWVLMWVRRSRD